MESIKSFRKYIFSGAISYEDRSDGKKGSILRYNQRFATSIGWIFTRPGSIFTLFELVSVLLFGAGSATALALVSCEFWDSDDCVILPAADTANLTLTTLCSFVMAFFANIIIERWWGIRSAVQAMFGAAYDTAMNTSAIVTQNLKGKGLSEVKKARETVDRINCMTILAVRMLLNSARGEKNLEDLCGDGIITLEDVAYFTSLPNGNPVFACHIMATLVQDLAARGLMGDDCIKGFNVQLVHQGINSMRGHMSAADMTVNVQVAYPFVQMVAIIVFAFLIQLIVVCAAFIAGGLVDQSKKGDLVIGYLTVSLYSIVLLGLLRLFEVLSNPLGDDIADFPIETYVNNFRKTITSITTNSFFLLESNDMMGPVSEDAIRETKKMACSVQLECDDSRGVISSQPRSGL